MMADSGSTRKEAEQWLLASTALHRIEKLLHTTYQKGLGKIITK